MLRDSDVEEVLDGVYDITWDRTDEGPPQLRNARRRSYLFDMDGDVPTLVDTCVAPRAERLIGGIESTGVEPERLLITHDHVDHAGAFDAVVDRFDVETWVPEADDLLAAEELDVTTEPDHFFGGGETIGRFEAVHIGGHTPGNSAFVDQAAGVLAAGDALSGADRRGLPAGYLIHPPQATHVGRPPGAVVEAERNLAKLLDYEFDVALVHHGANVYEDAGEKLRRYVSWEPFYAVGEEQSVHRPDRTVMDVDELDEAF